MTAEAGADSGTGAVQPFRAAVTGHRPGVLAKSGISAEAAGQRIAASALAAAKRRGRVLELRTGGALGIDRAAADAAIALRAAGEPVRLAVCLPFPPDVMTMRWPQADRDRLAAEIAAADSLEGPESETYTIAAYAARNRRLLAGADVLLACWSGDTDGGTADAVRAAVIERGIPARNERWGFRRISPVEAHKTGRLTRLPANAVFVFGSNTAGRHGAGAARDAARWFGAEEGVAEGRTGRSYAVPTVHWAGGRPGGCVASGDLRAAIERLVATAAAEPDTDFILTDIGAGLAGMAPDDLAAAWAGIVLPDNLLPTPAQRRLLANR
jgi:hypothetical protein